MMISAAVASKLPPYMTKLWPSINGVSARSSKHNNNFILYSAFDWQESSSSKNILRPNYYYLNYLTDASLVLYRSWALGYLLATWTKVLIRQILFSLLSLKSYQGLIGLAYYWHAHECSIFILLSIIIYL